MSPCSIPKRSLRTLAIGARQFVVHDALEITVCWAASKTWSLTPMQIMASASADGVVLEEERHGLAVAERVVDRHQLDPGARTLGEDRPVERAADPPEAVD